MPLSEQEQRLLDEMERHLMHHDADVVSAPGGRGISYRNVVYGSILVLAGLGALIIGVAVPLIIVGVLGFVLMVAGVVLAVSPSRAAAAPRSAAPGAAPAASKNSTSFMDRMNDRWDRRHDGG